MSDLLKIVTLSDKRKKLLIFLAGGPKNWDEIKDTLQVTSTGILPQIKILEDEKLIERDGRQFSLTETGSLVAGFLEPFEQIISVLEQERKFWDEHHIHALPNEFLMRLGELEKIRIIECSDEDCFEPHTQFIESLQQARQIKGIFPIVYPDYPDIFLNLTKEEKDLSIILTKTAFDKVKKDDYDMLMEGLNSPNANLYIYDGNIRFANYVTDLHFSLSLFHKTGLFDAKKDLVSMSGSALKFGEDLFIYYKMRSKKFIKNDVP